MLNVILITVKLVMDLNLLQLVPLVSLVITLSETNVKNVKKLKKTVPNVLIRMDLTLVKLVWLDIN